MPRHAAGALSCTARVSLHLNLRGSSNRGSALVCTGTNVTLMTFTPSCPALLGPCRPGGDRPDELLAQRAEPAVRASSLGVVQRSPLHRTTFGGLPHGQVPFRVLRRDRQRISFYRGPLPGKARQRFPATVHVVSHHLDGFPPDRCVCVATRCRSWGSPRFHSSCDGFPAMRSCLSKRYSLPVARGDARLLAPRHSIRVTPSEYCLSAPFFRVHREPCLLTLLPLRRVDRSRRFAEGRASRPCSTVRAVASRAVSSLVRPMLP